MAGIPDETIQEIRERCNIVDVVGGFVQLRRAGANSFKGLCPFHQEKTPSFFVDGARQSYHCFGCGKGGDVFRFFMDKENLPFVEAVKLLAGRAGVIIPENASGDPAESRKRAGERERIYQINAELCSLFRKILRDNPQGRVAQYLKKRGLPQETVDLFKIGAAPENWTTGVDYLRGLGFRDDEMVAAGVALRGHKDPSRVFDLFRDRLVFTIENEISRPIGFSARSLEANPEDGRKYVNSPETPIFKKSRNLYALSLARQAIGRHNMAILCEGQMDAIAFHRAGFACAVAPLGSAFTPEQAQILKRYTRSVVLAFDADSAGEKAFLRAAEILLPLSMGLKVMRIPGGKDPDELFRNGGADAVAEAVTSAAPWLDVLVEALRRRYDFSSPVGRGEAAGVVASYLEKVPDQVELEVYVSESARLLQVSENAVYSKLSGRRAQSTRRERFADAPPPEVAPKRKKYPAAMLTLLELALSSSDAARKIAEMLPPEELGNSDPVARAINFSVNAALNGESETAVEEIQKLLVEEPTPEISRILVEHVSFADAGRAVEECVADFRRSVRQEKRRGLTRKLALCRDESERNALLLEIQKL
ncbi:MAG: DNA primase [Victivallaceae bacterium]|nr:DNA primase [Victivallaceae bacterium]